jgi:hypothetical protein
VLVKQGYVKCSGCDVMDTHTALGLPPDTSAVIVITIDLVLIDQQSVGKRSLHLKDTVNAKKRWTTIYWRVNKFLKESHIVTRLAKERELFFDILFFGTHDCRICCSLA